MVNRENDANKEKESATLRRRKNLDFKSSKGKSADFTEQNCFGLFGKIEKTDGMDQMYIEQDFSFEAEAQNLILVGENDEDEMVTLEFIPESEEQKSPEIEERKLPEKPQIQSCIT